MLQQPFPNSGSMKHAKGEERAAQHYWWVAPLPIKWERPLLVGPPCSVAQPPLFDERHSKKTLLGPPRSGGLTSAWAGGTSLLIGRHLFLQISDIYGFWFTQVWSRFLLQQIFFGKKNSRWGIMDKYVLENVLRIWGWLVPTVVLAYCGYIL